MILGNAFIRELQAAFYGAEGAEDADEGNDQPSEAIRNAAARIRERRSAIRQGRVRGATSVGQIAAPHEDAA